MLIPHGSLILVIDGSQMQLLRNGGTDRFPKLEIIEQDKLNNPATHVLGSKGPGRVSESMGGAHHAYTAPDLHQRREDQFGERGMEALCQKAASGAPVILIAPPRMLATLRAARGDRLPNQVIAEVNKDLTHDSPTDIASFLQQREA